jgi:ATP-binding cassette subfamily B protein
VADGLTEISWPASHLGEAIAALGVHCGLGVRAIEVEAPGAKVISHEEGLGRWIEAAAAWLGLEAEPVEMPYAEVERQIRGAGPALLRLPEGTEARFLALVGGKHHRLELLTPDLERIRLAPEMVRAALCRDIEGQNADVVERMLSGTGVRGRRREQARRALACELLAAKSVGGCWLLRAAGSAGVAHQAREAHVPRLLLTLISAHVVEYGLWIVSWWLLGWMTLRGRLEIGWLLAWFLLLVSVIPFRLITTTAGGLFSIRAGAILKRRLLFGALKLEPEEIRHQGAGQLLGRVIESEAIESLALTGGFLGLTSAIELVLASFVLGAGAGSWFHVALLLSTALATCWLGVAYYRRRRRWTEQRLGMTNDLVERMIGHRTRLAQEARGHWNDGEDQALERYLGLSRALDRNGLKLQTLLPRCWLLVGLLGLAPAFLAGNRSSAALAVGIGGVVLAYRAFHNLVEGLDKIAAAAIAWERIKPFWHAAARLEPIGHPGFAAIPGPPAAVPSRNGNTLLDAHDLVFRYRDRGEPVLKGIAVRIAGGDRLLLEGPSGGGKSTLAALLAGCRIPQSGLLLLDGLDRDTLGAESWRRRVVIAPQFHDNHVLMGTLAFNALLGRDWPPRQADLEEAEGICRALELGPLLERMPAGLQQVVGETGWQLSHGEKSRLYIARALLQRADVIILDESFAALDPQTLRRTLALVLEKAPTVLVIAHP